MTELILERFNYSPTETEGRIKLDDGTTLYTLERPWRPDGPGGMPGESCVPDGRYELLPHVRPSDGADVLALRNPDLHVYYTPAERGDRPGRDLILIHVANWVSELRGCIAPGTERGPLADRVAVKHSADAMDILMDYVDANAVTHLLIRPACGTHD